ncbi:MAG: MaoC family dehydratase N-terminal domain-containing protein, partial [Anaerolineae bacterium]|nr:MaoC family dehydratase N-terminal domain-containing protein [Anaerolineae bacterium]
MTKRQFKFDELYTGQTFSPLSYALDEKLIREYVKAVGDESPLHRDLSQARAAGHRAILAPPSIAALYVLKAYRTDGVPPPGGVHLRQRFKFYRSILAGDVLHVHAWVADKYVKKGRKYLVIESLARNQDGAEVV